MSRDPAPELESGIPLVERDLDHLGRTQILGNRNHPRNQLSRDRWLCDQVSHRPSRDQAQHLSVRVCASREQFDWAPSNLKPQLLHQVKRLVLLISARSQYLPPIQPQAVQQSTSAQSQALFHPAEAILASVLMQSDDAAAGLPGPFLVNARPRKPQIND